MKKKFIRSAFILLLLSLIAKVLSFVVRIYIARTLSIDAMSLYALASPTLIFLITIAQMGLPSALSKFIAEKSKYQKSISASITLAIANNLILTVIFVLCIPLLANSILKQNSLQPVLYAIVPFIPLVTFSGLLKGYLMGKNRHIAANFSQIVEEIFRILFLLIFFQVRQSFDSVSLASIAMLSISVAEIGSIFTMLFCIPNKKHTNAFFHNPTTQQEEVMELLSISLPMTGSRLIGSFTSFLEPLLLVQCSGTFAAMTIRSYTELNAYILPILTLSSFATVTLSNWLLPSFTYFYSRNKKNQAIQFLFYIVLSCFVIGCVVSGISFFFAEEVLQLFYHSTFMAPQLKALSLPFALFAIQAPLSSILHATSHSDKAFVDTTVGCVIRLAIILFFSTTLKENVVLYSLCIGMLVTTFMHAFRLFSLLWNKR